MDPIDVAIRAIDAHELGEPFSYAKYARHYGVSRTTLSRRHRGVQPARSEVTLDKRALSPPQESKLIDYIIKLHGRGLPPTRNMIAMFAGEILGQDEPLSIRWVDAFTSRYADVLVKKYTLGQDVASYKADSYKKYVNYFTTIGKKLKYYNVEPRNTYNIDKKGI